MPNAAPHSSDEAYDQWLVVRAQGGEEEALRQLVVRWSSRLGRHALRLTGDPHGAADVAQEAWVSIVRGLPRLADPACFRRWAYRIVSNKSADWVRQRQRSRPATGEEPVEPIAPRPATSGAEQADSFSLRSALAQMADKDRAILAMHYLEGMPIAEIGDSLALPRGTVKSRLYHARRRLKSAIVHPHRPENPPVQP